MKRNQLSRGLLSALLLVTNSVSADVRPAGDEVALSPDEGPLLPQEFVVEIAETTVAALKRDDFNSEQAKGVLSPGAEGGMVFVPSNSMLSAKNNVPFFELAGCLVMSRNWSIRTKGQAITPFTVVAPNGEKLSCYLVELAQL